MTDEQQNADEPKIIVDEDWKSQVEKEKEELKQQSSQATDDSASSTSDTIDESMQLPPVSFSVLLSTLATQAMAGLGIVPDPMTGKPDVNRPLAKHFIDTIAMLEEKTKGNLTESESTQLRDGLHQLRMIFLQMPASEAAPPEEPKKPTIELP